MNSKYKSSKREESSDAQRNARMGNRSRRSVSSYSDYVLSDGEYEEDFLEEEEVEKKDSILVFGRNVFNNNSLDFAPSSTLATPKNYVLGPGDEVIVDVFGANQSTIRSENSSLQPETK